MKFKLGDIVRIDEPDSFPPVFWNRSFKVIDIDEHSWWLVVEVIGEPIITRRRMRARVGTLPAYRQVEIRSFNITEDSQKDLILVKRNEEIIPKAIKKHKI